MPVLLYKMEKGKEMPTLFTMRSMHVSLENLGELFFCPDYGFFACILSKKLFRLGKENF